MTIYYLQYSYQYILLKLNTHNHFIKYYWKNLTKQMILLLQMTEKSYLFKPDQKQVCIKKPAVLFLQAGLHLI